MKATLELEDRGAKIVVVMEYDTVELVIQRVEQVAKHFAEALRSFGQLPGPLSRKSAKLIAAAVKTVDEKD